jgi:hypothetical protein
MLKLDSTQVQHPLTDLHVVEAGGIPAHEGFLLAVPRPQPLAHDVGVERGLGGEDTLQGGGVRHLKDHHRIQAPWGEEGEEARNNAGGKWGKLGCY